MTAPHRSSADVGPGVFGRGCMMWRGVHDRWRRLCCGMCHVGIRGVMWHLCCVLRRGVPDGTVRYHAVSA